MSADSANSGQPLGLVAAAVLFAVGLVVVLLLRRPATEELAFMPLEAGKGTVTLQLASPHKLRVVLDVRATDEGSSLEFAERLSHSELTLETATGAKVTCSAHNGWSDNTERNLKRPFIKAAENDCVLPVLVGPAKLSVTLAWKAEGPEPRVDARILAEPTS